MIFTGLGEPINSVALLHFGAQSGRLPEIWLGQGYDL